METNYTSGFFFPYLNDFKLKWDFFYNYFLKITEYGFLPRQRGSNQAHVTKGRERWKFRRP